jgi:hypothetical protein
MKQGMKEKKNKTDLTNTYLASINNSLRWIILILSFIAGISLAAFIIFHPS